MCQGLDPDKMACKGAPTIPAYVGVTEGEECQACGTAIAWDLVDHPFCGFQTCPHAKDHAERP